MSLVVAKVTKGKATMLTDRIAVTGTDKDILRWPKMFSPDKDTMVGWVGSIRAGQILEYSDWPTNNALTGKAYAVTVIVPFIRKIMANCTEADKKEFEETTFLLASSRGLFRIYGDMQVLQSKHDFDAIGSGSQIALGAMFSGASLRLAIQATESFITTVDSGIR